MRVAPQPVQAHNLGDPPAGAVEVLDEIEQGSGRGVVDQGHQVGDVQADGGDPRRNPIEFPFEVKGVEANQRTTEVEVVGVAYRPTLHDRVTEQLTTLDQPSSSRHAKRLMLVGVTAYDRTLNGGFQHQLRHNAGRNAPEQVG